MPKQRTTSDTMSGERRSKHLHSLSTLEETTVGHVTLGKDVVDTGCSRYLIGQKTLENMRTDAHKEGGGLRGHDLPFW